MRSRLSKTPPYYTTFRRNVRRWVVEASAEIPLEMVKEQVRAELNGRKHSIIESTWRDHPGWYTVTEIQAGQMDRRTVSVRYVTGGMRHKLPASLDWPEAPNQVEFARAHGL